MRNDAPRLPIGVFDSGVGGLTVLRALRRRLPAESFLYLGDTARLPYGTKSPQSVERYALQCTRQLVARGVKMLVVACNTASAVALEPLARAWPGLPVVGVVRPGARAGCAATRSGHIAVIATEGTVRGGAYQRAIQELCPQARIVARACPLFVPLAEEGWTSGPVAEAVAREYLEPLFPPGDRRGADAPDTLVLGCTHFPLLAGAVARVVGPEVAVIDSAQTAAAEVADVLEREGLGAPQGTPEPTRFLATDDPERFARVGGLFLGRTLAREDVAVVDL
ncbi:glutamate racemase [Desulfocurvus sp.]|jgi:glutamate racemase|uniref:glutamate racemase n=1 Tax=Desulfocurvus sp. TaxID=2871698 RepID=UPI0025C2C70E|nr:glutamate racemase [Desulfocurvus sp.]MCK9241150.1 glutamate racemase [Desulfocurvus sp.]